MLLCVLWNKWIEMKVINLIKVICLIISLLCLITSQSLSFSDPRFKNTTDKGDFGESITEYQMKLRGYSSLPSKHTGNQGLDHVFVQKNSRGKVKDIIIAETKADSSTYKPEQMSNEKIDNQIQKMKNSSDPEVRKTGELLEKNRNKIRKEHWRHNTSTGKSTVYEIGANGQIKSTKAVYNTKRVQRSIYQNRKNPSIKIHTRAKPKALPRKRLPKIRLKKPIFVF
jgi:hypothetical protein